MLPVQKGHLNHATTTHFKRASMWRWPVSKLTLVISNGGHYYRPQRSYGKVMFLHLCVILFTGGSLSGGSLSGGSLSGGSLSGGSLSGGSLSGGLCLGGLCLGGLWGLCPWGLCPGMWVSTTETPRTVTCGWYASYWNAFLDLQITNLSDGRDIHSNFTVCYDSYCIVWTDELQRICTVTSLSCWLLQPYFEMFHSCK